MITRRPVLGILGFFAATLLMVSCDVSIQPFSEETGLFSIYGYLTISNGPHYIRVKDLNNQVLGDSLEPMNASVTLTNTQTGETETLVDSVVTIDRLVTHNFRSEMRVEPEEKYQLTVERSDGRTAQASATMPSVTPVNLTPATNASCNAPLRVEFPEINEKRFIRAQIGMKYGGKLTWLGLDVKESYTRGLRRGFKPASKVEKIVPANVTPIVDCDPTRYCNLLDDKKIRIAYTHFGPDWPADSVLTDPLQSTVENGLGVFGGLRRDTLIATTDATLRCPGSDTVPCKPVPPPCPGGGDCTCPAV